MPNHYDVIVIGAGVIGLSCGYFLTQKGKRVLVMERGEVGGGASGACDDMILLQSKKPGLTLKMAFESLEQYKGLSQELRMDLEFHTLGGMILIDSPDYLHIMEEYVKEQRSCGLDVEIIGRKETRDKQPHVAGHVSASTFSALDSQVSPFKVVFGFMNRGRDQGMAVQSHCQVVDIIQKPQGHWQVRNQHGELFESEVLVNAAGVWAPLVGKLVGMEIPIYPKRGQILVTEKLPPLGQTNVWSAEYIVSKLKPELAPGREEKLVRMGLGFSFSRTGHDTYLIGSTREHVGYDTGTTYEAFTAVTEQAVRLFPIMKNVHIIRSFAGLRPASEDGCPILGEVPGFPGFFIAAGHEGDGIALAPITGRILSQMVCGQATELDVKELSPARFMES